MSLEKCLNCPLPDCLPTDPGCPLYKGKKNKTQHAYYRRKKADPEFKKKRYEMKKRWRKTPAGKASMAQSAKKYNKANPEVGRAATKRYREKKRRNQECPI